MAKKKEDTSLTPLYWTKTTFLRCISLCYFSAFLSIYVQIPGLYGEKGLLPAHHTLDNLQVQNLPKWRNWEDFAENWRPNLLTLIPEEFGLNVELKMDLLCWTGILVSIFVSIWPSFCNKIAFFTLWLCYKSLFDVGKTFLWFQWDTLLLETGFLCVILAPMLKNKKETNAWDGINLFLIKWLLFRMMFSSGVVKLLSRCPAWWGLTALPTHYESQCLPTWMAWYAYHLPGKRLHALSYNT